MSEVLQFFNIFFNDLIFVLYRENMESFFNQIKEILDSGTDRIGAFQISEIQVYAQITGDGQVALMGSGVKIEALGGIKFTLCRIPR